MYKFFFNSIISFFFVNGIIFTMNTENLFDIANAISLRNVASSIINEKKVDFNNTDSITIMISNFMFEKEFESKTPLDKDKLYNLIYKIISKDPKRIIFDLDISPDYNFLKKSNEVLNSKIYNLLIENSNKIDIILPFAFISEAKENKLLKLEWVDKMCKGGVNFGSPLLTSEMGISLEFRDYNNLLSHVAYDNNSTVCRDIVLEKNTINNLQTRYKKNNDNSEHKLINYNRIDSNTFFLNSIDELENKNLKNKTVFIGGGYGFSDKYITPSGEKFGVQIHEAIFYTLKNKIDIANIYITLFIDFLLAISFGLLIEFILKKREEADSLNLIALNNILLFSLLIIFIVISNIVSSKLYHDLYIWLNPIPIIVGMFLDSIIGISKKNISNLNEKNKIYYIIVSIFILFGIISFMKDCINL